VLPSIGRPKIFRDIGSDSAYTGALAASRETTIKTLVKHTIAKAIVGEWLDFLYDILRRLGGVPSFGVRPPPPPASREPSVAWSFPLALGSSLTGYAGVSASG